MSADTGGRKVAVLALVAAGGASLGANVAETLSKPHADLGAGVTALVPPVLGFLGVELLTRVAWPDTTAARAAKWVGVLLVSAANALVSFWHVYGWLAHHCHYDPVTAVAGAVGIDGLLLMSAAALLVTSPVFQAAQAVTAGAPDSDQVDVQATTPVDQVDTGDDQVDVEGDQVDTAPVHVDDLVFTSPPKPGEETLQAVKAVAQRHPRANKREIAERLGVSRTTVVRYMNKLEMAAA